MWKNKMLYLIFSDSFLLKLKRSFYVIFIYLLRYLKLGNFGIYSRYNSRKDIVIMKKIVSILLSVILCTCVMVSVPWNRCSAAEQMDERVPYAVETEEDDF